MDELLDDVPPLPLNGDLRRLSERVKPAPARAAGTARVFQPVITMSIGMPAEAFRMRREVAPLLGRLQNAAARGSGVLIHLTSAERGDGVSTIAREIASAAASTPFCRVLLLDHGSAEDEQVGTLGRPLPDIVQSYLRRGEGEVASVSVGATTFHAAALTPSFEPGAIDEAGRTLSDLYEGLRRRYDLMIVDCPPILEAPRFLRIGHETPEVLLVVEAEKTRIRATIRAKDEILLAGAHLAGVVLNRRRHYIPGFLYRRL